jgi:hypothetical protein
MAMTETGRASQRNQWLILIGFAVVLGAVSGGTFAFFAARDGEISPWWGLAMGSILALGMLLVGAVVLRRTTSTVEAMRGLDKGERKAVGRAVGRGEAVDDPRLAHAAVLLAEQQLSPFPGPEWFTNGTLLLVLGAVLLALSLISGQVSSAVIGLGLFGLGGLNRWTRARTRDSLEANRRLIDA